MFILIIKFTNLYKKYKLNQLIRPTNHDGNAAQPLPYRRAETRAVGQPAPSVKIHLREHHKFSFLTCSERTRYVCT